MRWEKARRSRNIEDRRGRSSGPAVAGGTAMLLRLLPWLLRSRLGRVLLVVGVLGVGALHLLGVDVSQLLPGEGAHTARAPQPFSAEEQQLAEFVAVVLADTETTWHQQFQALGKTYEEPVLVLFSGNVRSACGFAQAAMGPFYCGADNKVYIDLSFYRDLRERHQAPGDFAQAYVIAHEVGHHVQNLLGISARVRSRQQRLTEADANKLSVKQELQADCFAGIWAHYANFDRALLEPGDIEEALAAAAAIGDDRLQQQARGYVTPDSFTHGRSEQRARWFSEGFRTGALSACDTFGAVTP